MLASLGTSPKARHLPEGPALLSQPSPTEHSTLSPVQSHTSTTTATRLLRNLAPVWRFSATAPRAGIRAHAPELGQCQPGLGGGVGNRAPDQPLPTSNGAAGYKNSWEMCTMTARALLRPLPMVGRPLNKATLLTTRLHLPTSVLPKPLRSWRRGCPVLGGGPQPELQLSHRLGGTQGKPLCSLACFFAHGKELGPNW